MAMTRGIFTVVLSLIMFLSYMMCGYGYEITYIAHKKAMGLDYGEKRIIPVLLDMSYDKYMYSIRINNKGGDDNLKVFLIDKNNRPLSNTFSTSLGKDVMLIVNNNIKRYKEIYILFEYYAPSSRNLRKEVVVDLYPVISEEVSNGKVVPQILPAIHYDFNVYLNAYLSSTSLQYSPSSSMSDISYTATSISSSTGGGNTLEDTSVDNISQANNNLSTYSVENPDSTLYESNVGKSYDVSNNGTSTIDSTYYAEKSNSTLPTGKVIGAKGISYSTYVIVLVGVLVLYYLWKKV